MPWWWLWLTAGVHRAAFGSRESLVESLVGELVALSGRESRREGAASQHRLLLVLPFLQSLKGQDFVPFVHGGAALRVKKCFYERARTASPAHTPFPPVGAQGSSAARTRERNFGKKRQENGRVLAKKRVATCTAY